MLTRQSALLCTATRHAQYSCPHHGSLMRPGRTGVTQLTCRSASTSSQKLCNPAIVVSDDGSTIVCWHPEPKFPYEHSKPLPRKQSELEEGESVLKVQHLADYKRQYNSDGPSDLELQKIFFTTKHKWLPRPRKIYENEPLPDDREGL